MHPMYDLAKMICSLILIISIFRLVIELGYVYIEYFARGNVRVMQEFISGFISISNVAPSESYFEGIFPEVSHEIKIVKEPPLINISPGGVSQMPRIKFREYPEISYTIAKSLNIEGDCVEKWCVLSGENINKIIIEKSENIIKIKKEEIKK